MELYVGNLSFDTTEDTLRGLFASCGEVSGIKLITDRDTGKSKGFGFIQMGAESEAKAAISRLNGKEVDGREIKVNQAQKKSTGSSSRY